MPDVGLWECHRIDNEKRPSRPLFIAVSLRFLDHNLHADLSLLIKIKGWFAAGRTRPDGESTLAQPCFHQHTVAFHIAVIRAWAHRQCGSH